jgi:hypothetical protein
MHAAPEPTRKLAAPTPNLTTPDPKLDPDAVSDNGITQALTRASIK